LYSFPAVLSKSNRGIVPNVHNLGIQTEQCRGFFWTSSPAGQKQGHEPNSEQALHSSRQQTRNRSKASCESSLPGRRAGSRSSTMHLRPGLCRTRFRQWGRVPTNAKEAAKIVVGHSHSGPRICLRDFKAPAALLASPSTPVVSLGHTIKNPFLTVRREKAGKVLCLCLVAYVGGRGPTRARLGFGIQSPGPYSGGIGWRDGL
jgi:hypothetical protein